MTLEASPLDNRGCAVPTDRQGMDKTTLKESPSARMGVLLQSTFSPITYYPQVLRTLRLQGGDCVAV